MPQFSIQNQDGAEVISQDLLGRKTVLFFYPKAATPTCTVEACNLRDHYRELMEAGFAVYGISADSPEKLQKWKARHDFPFDLLADEDHQLSEKFGVWQEKKLYGKTYMGIVRTTFLFDENGRCTRVIQKVKAAEASAQILAG